MTAPHRDMVEAFLIEIRLLWEMLFSVAGGWPCDRANWVYDYSSAIKWVPDSECSRKEMVTYLTSGKFDILLASGTKEKNHPSQSPCYLSVDSTYQVSQE